MLYRQAKSFDQQAELGLSPGFNLLDYAQLKGWGCKVPQSKLFQYLKSIGDGSIAKETPDCSVTNYLGTISQNESDDPNATSILAKTKLISTTDFFYPLVEDPYLQGRISCCNVLSDIYAMGISRVDHMLMILGVSLQMQENDREIVTREMMRGFNDCATEAGTKITGG